MLHLLMSTWHLVTVEEMGFDETIDLTTVFFSFDKTLRGDITPPLRCLPASKKIAIPGDKKVATKGQRGRGQGTHLFLM